MTPYVNKDRDVVIAGDWRFAPADELFKRDAMLCRITCDRQYFLVR